jgi:hypothetical protein
MTLEINVFKGQEIFPHVHHLIDMRLTTFCEFPYLYVGDKENELPYAKEYALNSQGLLVVATKDGHLAGMLSGMPLNSPAPYLKHWCKRLKKQGIDIERSFYAGELIIAPPFQKGRCFLLLLHRFLQEVKMMNFLQIHFVTCSREENHPLRPENYPDEESMWEKIGARKTPPTLPLKWVTRQLNGSVKNERNKLIWWVKDISDINML